MFLITDDRLEDIFRLQTKTYLEIQSISRRIIKLERQKQHLPVVNEDENDLVTELLPLNTIDETINFDKIIEENATTVSQFVSSFCKFFFYIIFC